MKYRSACTPIIMHYLARVARDYFKKQWNTAVSKALMTDEVKIGDTQWLTTTARLFVSGNFVELCVSPSRFPGEERDAHAIANVLHSSFRQHGISEWLDDRMVALTTDGASVLLSGLSSEVQKKAPGALPSPRGTTLCVPAFITRTWFLLRPAGKTMGKNGLLAIPTWHDPLRPCLQVLAMGFAASCRNDHAYNLHFPCPSRDPPPRKTLEGC